MEGDKLQKEKRKKQQLGGLSLLNFLSSKRTLYLADICVYVSNGVESPIHLVLHSLTPPVQGCGELLSR